MTNELFAILIDATWALSAAVVLVLLLRWPLRRLFGATLAYQAWLLVPVLIATIFVPQLTVQHRPAVVAVLHPASVMHRTQVEAAIDWIGVGVSLWLLGAALFALWFWRAHAAFVRRLGVLVPDDGLFYSESPDAGPALLGLFRPRIILPSDFSTRYTPREQVMIVEHERTHARRRDMFANLFQACLQCLFWFNPLVHFAALYFRTDQELSCDAAVIRKHPGAMHTYAQALLKSHGFSTAAPATVACSWRFNHPVKERLMSLKQTQPGHARRIAGRLAVLSLVCLAGYGALMARASEASVTAPVMYDVAMSLKTDVTYTLKADGFLSGSERASTPRVLARSGEAFLISSENDGAKWTAEFVVTKAGPGGDVVKLAGTIKDESAIVSRPTLLVRLGGPAKIKIDKGDGKSFELAMTITEATQAKP